MAPLTRWFDFVCTFVRVASQHAEAKAAGTLLGATALLLVGSRRGWLAHTPWWLLAVACVSIAGLVRYIASGGKCTVAVDMAGKTVCITGGNTGIGRAAAKQLLRQGARVVLACRNPVLGTAAVSELKSELGLAADSDIVRYVLGLCAAV